MALEPPFIPDQEFFNIGEACRIVQIAPYTLRYWESKLKLLRPARRTSGHRRYAKRDLEIILRVKDLLHGRHLTLAGARKALLREIRGEHLEIEPAGKTNGKSLQQNHQSMKVLREIRSELQELLAEL